VKCPVLFCKYLQISHFWSTCCYALKLIDWKPWKNQNTRLGLVWQTEKIHAQALSVRSIYPWNSKWCLENCCKNQSRALILVGGPTLGLTDRQLDITGLCYHVANWLNGCRCQNNMWLTRRGWLDFVPLSSSALKKCLQSWNEDVAKNSLCLFNRLSRSIAYIRCSYVGHLRKAWRTLGLAARTCFVSVTLLWFLVILMLAFIVLLYCRFIYSITLCILFDNSAILSWGLQFANL